MTQITANGRETLEEAVKQVASSGKRIVLRRGKKVVGAVISEKDLARLEALEDRLDVEEAERRLADPAEVPVPLSETLRRLGLA
jgi:PHD/YefM family antitoxin component YafN of YafNO toxin-antitoxin module